MDITIQQVRSSALESGGRYYQTFTAQSAQELIKIHHLGCVGDTEVRNIQIEKGSTVTEFTVPKEHTLQLSGLFKDFRNLKLDLENSESDIRAKIQTTATEKMEAFFNKNVSTTIKQSADKIQANVAKVLNNAVMKADISITPEGITLGAGKVVNGETISSLFVTNPESIKAITKLMQVSGNLLVNGTITTDKMKANSITAGLLAANSVESDHIVAKAVEGRHIKFDEAFFNTMLADDAFIQKLTAKQAFINYLSTVKIEASQIKADDAFIKKLTSAEAFIDVLDSRTIKAKQISTNLLKSYTGLIGGFRIGPHPKGWGNYITGTESFVVGMSDGGANSNSQAALWVHWSKDWNTIPPDVWYVAQSGKMFAHNGASFKGGVSVDATMYIEPHDGELYYKGTTLSDLLVRKMNASNITSVARYSDDNGPYVAFYSPEGNSYCRTTSWSDQRFKFDIQKSRINALECINQLNVYAYNFRKESTHYRKEIGLIAQEVGQYLPDAHEIFDGIETYNPFFFIPYLVKAIQELDIKITNLEKRLQHE